MVVITMTDDTNQSENGDGAPEDESGLARRYPDRLLEQGRERGLSRADREFLASGGETVNSEAMAVNTRTRIRKRIRASIVDFWLMTEYLDDHDRDLIFRRQKGDWDNWELQIGLKSAIQFFYTALEHTDLTDFDTVLTSAIHDAEREKRDGPVLVDVDFDVEVDEQFRVQEAYDKFQRGVPLDPMEVGVLLVTGRVHDSEKIEKLAEHARSHGLVEHSVAPLLGEQLADISGDEPVDAYQYTWAHLSETEYPDLPAAPPRISDYQHLQEEHLFRDADYESPSLEDLVDDDLAQGLSELEGDETDSADAEVLDERENHEAALRRLSAELGKPITVDDEVVYEDGDRHVVEQNDGDGEGPPDDNR